MKTLEEARLPVSMLVKSQFKTYGAVSYADGHRKMKIVATVRYDDQCGNGHNSFGITADIRTQTGLEVAGGCCHNEVAQHFPHLAPFIKWHLMSSDGPMHYIANAKYWAGQEGYCDGKPNSPPNEKHLKSTIVFGAVTEFDKGVDPMLLARAGSMVGWLKDRLPALVAEFKAAVESLGFTY